MKNTKFINKKSRSLLSAVLLGVGVSMAMTLLIALLISFCIFNEYIEFSAIVVTAIIGQILCAFLGALTACFVASEGKLAAAFIAGGGYYLLILCIGILCFDGVSASALWSLLGCSAGTLIGVFVCFKLKTSVKSNRKRKRIR